MKLFQFLVRIQFLSYYLPKARTYFNCVLLILLVSVKTEIWASDQHEIIINPTVSEKTLSVNSLRSIFSMRLKTWPDGTKIRVFVLPDDDRLHQSVAKEKLNVFPYQLRSTWDRLVYSGTGQAPIKVNSAEEMRAKVASTPGAIGYLWRANINENVNVLEIK